MKAILLSSLLTAALVAAAPAAVLRSGHTDLGIAYEDNALFPHIHDEGNDIEYLPGGAVLLVKYAARETIPAGAEYDFLRPAGETHLWRLPKTENPALLFLGLGTEEIDAGVVANDLVTVRLTAITAPPGGKFTAYDVDAFDVPQVLLNSGDGISIADSFPLTAASHRHVNWTFTQPGDYKVTFTITAKVGTVNKTATATYKFHVQTEAESTASSVLVSRDGIGLDIGGVVLTGIENADRGTDAMLVSFSGEDVTAADNTAIIQVVPNGVSTVLVREGDEPSGLAGVKVNTLSSPVANAAGQFAFSGTLLIDNALVNSTNNAYLAYKDGVGFSLIAREGEVPPGLPATYVFNGFGNVLMGDAGVMIFYASAKTPTASRPFFAFRSGYWRRLANGTVELLAATGTVLTTEIGPKAIKSLSALNPGPSRDQDRAFSNDGALSLLVSFTDGTASVVRFAAP